MEVSGQVRAPADLLQRKEFQYPLDKRLDVSQSRPGRYGVEKNLLHLPGIVSRPSSP
jgi:hypothetical protein